MAKQQNNSTPTLLQKIFVGSLALMFVMTIAQNAYYMAAQLPSNPNLSSFLPWFLSIIIVMFVWVVVYLTRRDRSWSLRTVFEVSLLTISAVLIATGLSWLMMFVQLPMNFIAPDARDGLMWWMAIYTSLPFAVTIPLLVIAIRRLGATNQW